MFPSAASRLRVERSIQPWLRSSDPSSSRKSAMALHNRTMTRHYFLPTGRIFYISFFVPRIKEGPLSVPGFSLHMYKRVFGKMPRFEPELLRRKPGVLPMSYTHPFLSTSLPGRSFSGLGKALKRATDPTCKEHAPAAHVCAKRKRSTKTK